MVSFAIAIHFWMVHGKKESNIGSKLGVKFAYQMVEAEFLLCHNFSKVFDDHTKFMDAKHK